MCLRTICNVISKKIIFNVDGEIDSLRVSLVLLDINERLERLLLKTNQLACLLKKTSSIKSISS